LIDLSHLLEVSSQPDEAVAATSKALDLYQVKGNVVAAAAARLRLDKIKRMWDVPPAGNFAAQYDMLPPPRSGGDAMSGHFDNTQTIKLADGGLILGGPQVLETGETVERLDVWVWQDDCVCVVKGNPQVGDTWSITTTPGLHH